MVTADWWRDGSPKHGCAHGWQTAQQFHCYGLRRLWLHVSKFNPHCEGLREWKLNLTMVFRSGALRRWLGLDKVIKLKVHNWILVALWKKRGHMIRTHTHTHCLMAWPHVLPWDSLSGGEFLPWAFVMGNSRSLCCENEAELAKFIKKAILTLD
jgi:hypothetical protein